MENGGKIVFDIIQELCGRAGFDDWWYNLDSDIQEEIHEALVKKLPIDVVSKPSFKEWMESIGYKQDSKEKWFAGLHYISMKKELDLFQEYRKLNDC